MHRMGWCMGRFLIIIGCGVYIIICAIYHEYLEPRGISSLQKGATYCDEYPMFNYMYGYSKYTIQPRSEIIGWFTYCFAVDVRRNIVDAVIDVLHAVEMAHSPHKRTVFHQMLRSISP